MKFLFLEPFYGGSHRDFADGLIKHSHHHIDLVTLPARFWKWRMRGAALYLAGKLPAPRNYDGLIVTDLMSLADLKALWQDACPPTMVYFHENQLTYPLAPGESMDYQFGFTDITTAVTADRVLFNSRTHFDTFFSILPGFLNMMPEYHPRWVIEAIRSKSGVLYPGCRFKGPGAHPVFDPIHKTIPPLIIWNHRWEFDKNPDEFVTALDAIASMGLDFRLALLGENFQSQPKAFLAAKQRFAQKIVCCGFVESKHEYRQWLRRGTAVISTAIQENFGIAVVEAIRYGCIPLLPNRLVYPEIIPEAFHLDVLYDDLADLVDKLADIIKNHRQYSSRRTKLSEAMACFAWDGLIDTYDAELDRLAGLRRGQQNCEK
jgi:glycosyltransferase involved in cell wall biosynthesis